MNCDQVTSHLTELARHEPMEAGLQADCQTHLATCEECRESLAEVELLQRTLRLVARTESRQEASPAVEYRLLAALRQQSEAPAERGSRIWWSSPLLWRSAAITLLAAGLALTFWGWMRRHRETQSTPDTAVSSPAPTLPPLLTPPAVPPVAAVELPRHDRSKESRRPRAPRASLVRARSGVNAGIAPSAADSETEEALTDYLLLSPGQRYYPIERGQLIRVMVPRSTLGSFGFPVNPERAMMPVKADLVVGEDGMARAIRFIK